MNSSFKLMTIVATSLLSGLGHAQEASEPAPTNEQTLPAAVEQTDKREAQADAEARTPAKTDNKQRNSDIFQPSEEISEDFAVSFPVDI